MSTTLDMAEISRDIETYEQDMDWVLNHYDSLIKQFSKEFVAVSNQKVLANSASIIELTNKLRSKYGEECDRILIEFIYPKHPNLVLRHASLLQAR